MCRQLRFQKGQALIAIVGLFTFCVFPLIAVFCFELSRVTLAKQQLQNACEAAALAAVATLASSDNSSPTTTHNDCMQVALNIFKQNYVLGTELTTSTIVESERALTCGVGEAKLYFEFVNPITKAVEPITSPSAKVVRIVAVFGDKLAFGQYIGISQWNIRANADGGVPNLDVALCFDVSGSMDDQTPVTLVRRKWDATAGSGGAVTYDVPVGANGPARGKIFDVLQPAPTGTSLNAMEPQWLDEAWWNAKLNFSEYLASYYGVPGLRSLGGYPDQGKPPGNYPPGTAPTWDGYNAFTDMVVNIDGKTTFGGFTYGGFSFPDLPTLVEAARGNLENNTVYLQSKANTATSVTPRSGYQNAYRLAAAQQLQPIKDAKDASLLFTSILNTDTDCHFGFVSFDASTGTSPGSTENWWNIDLDSPYGTKLDFPRPMVPLDRSVGATNYSSVNSAIQSCVAMGSTNIGAAIHEAVQDLKAHSRTGSVKAIVLFTDGQPTAPSGPLDADPWMNARKAADEANKAGIAVYTIGLAQNSAIIPGETLMLNDSNDNPNTGGIAAIARHGGTFNLVTNSANLRQAFEKIARRLVQLVAAP